MSLGKTYPDYLAIRNTYLCLRLVSTVEQNARVLVKWLKEHPEQLHENANLLTFQAFQDA
jgi:hypothetical protein